MLTNTFISVEGRSLIAKMPTSVERTWDLYLAVDNALLDHKLFKWLAFKDTTAKAIEHLAALKDKAPMRSDSPRVDLRAYAESYQFICERYLQRDLDRPNAIRVAQICARYSYQKITRVTTEIGGKSHAPAFLDACLSTLKDETLDQDRRDSVIDELIRQSAAVVVPHKRFPGIMQRAMFDAHIDDEIDILLRKDVA